MADSEPSLRTTPQYSTGGALLGFAIGVASDVALWILMRSGPVVEFPHSRNNYSDEVYLTDVQAHVWYSLALAAAMTLVGGVLVKRGITSVGTPLLLLAGAGLGAVVCITGLMVSP